MFCRAGLLVLAFSLISFSKPTDTEAGIRIPLAPRGGLTKEDGTFDHQRAILQSYKTHNKHRQNLINLERNVGRVAFNKGAEIKPLLKLPGLDKRQAEPLTNQEEIEWTGPIYIGSNSQKFTIDFDTGSSDLWVPNAHGCSGCRGRKTYDSTKSKTSKSLEGDFRIRYGDGSNVSGPIFQDTVSVAGVNATGQTFSAVTQLSQDFVGNSLDGILGMSFQQISNLNAPPFFQNAFSQKAVSNNEFAFKLAASGSELFLGGTNSRLYTGSIEFHSIIHSGFWQAKGAKVLSGGKTVASGFSTIIDSGTTLIYGPPDQVKALYATIEGSQLFDNENGLFSYPCNATPTVAFNWGGKTWSISLKNFNLGQTDEGSSQCVGAIAGQDLGLGDDVWLLGDSFMKNVYTVFSFAKNSVGFATLK